MKKKSAKKNQTPKIPRLRVYVKYEDAQEVKEGIIKNNLAAFGKILKGPPAAIRIKTTTGKPIVIFTGSSATPANSNYNFTICPTIDKRTWIDIHGNAIICGRNEREQLTECNLSPEELGELLAVPYEK